MRSNAVCREAELARQKMEAEKKEREMQRLQEEERIRAEKAAERREMQRLAKKFAVSLEGSATISIPPPVNHCCPSICTKSQIGFRHKPVRKIRMKDSAQPCLGIWRMLLLYALSRQT